MAPALTIAIIAVAVVIIALLASLAQSLTARRNHFSAAVQQLEARYAEVAQPAMAQASLPACRTAAQHAIQCEPIVSFST